MLRQGYQILHQSNWPQMGQTMEFFSKTDFSTFWLIEPKYTEMWSDKVPDLSYLGPIYPMTDFVAKSDTPVFRANPILYANVGI